MTREEASNVWDVTSAVEEAYELALFQICDDGGVYTEMTAHDIRQLLKSTIIDKLAETGSPDPETLKTAALQALGSMQVNTESSRHCTL